MKSAARNLKYNVANDDSGDVVHSVEFTQRAGGPIVDCPAGLVVMAGECHDNYVAANAFMRRDSVCYKCDVGCARRDEYADFVRGDWDNDE